MIHTQDADFTLLNCDVIEGLRSLADESVHCVVTSPPYWGLRDYGADGQIGLEATPELFVARMVEVFREVRRVLRADGTCWLNLGDSYASSPPGNRGTPDEAYKSSGLAGAKAGSRYMQTLAASVGTKRNTVVGDLKPKDLVGIPWRVALALQADGWYLRSDIIWSKPNPMPESVTDRPTKAHEYVFLLAKSHRYFFDQEAVLESAQWERWGDQTNGKEAVLESAQWERWGDQTNGKHEGSGSAASWIKPKSKQELTGESRPGGRGDTYSGFNERWNQDVGAAARGRNVRSVWEIATQPYPEAHFATYPEELVRRCVLAGTSERGCCPECGAPWERDTEVSYEKSPVHGAGSVVGRHYETGSNNYDGAGMPRLNKRVETLGWRPACSCSKTVLTHTTDGELPYEHGEPLAPIPCTVLDPFLGSGTTAYVARKHGRRSIGIELNPDYCQLAARRMQQQSLFAEPAA